MTAPLTQDRLVRDVQIALVLILALGLGWYGLELSFGSVALSPPSWELLASFLPSALLVAVSLAGELRRHPYSLHMMHLAALGVLLVFAPLHQVIRDSFPRGMNIPENELLWGNACVFFWVAGYLGGRQVARWLSPEVVGRLPLLERRPNEWGLWLALILCIGSLAYLASYGTTFATTRAGFGVDLPRFGVIRTLRLLFRFFPVLALGAWLHHWVRNREARSPTMVLLLVGLLSLNFLINNPIAAARTWTLTVLLGWLAIAFLSRRPNGASMLPGMVLGLLLLPALNLGRTQEDFDTAMLTPQTQAISEGMTSGDFDAFSNLILIKKLVDFDGPSYGVQLAGALLFWVPRSLWPEKPLGSGHAMAEALGLTHSNIASPLPAEAIINFGIWSTPFMAAAFGALLYILDARYFRNRVGSAPSSFRILDVLFPFWLGLIVFVTRGDLLNGTYLLVGTTVASLVALLPGSRPPEAPT